MKVAEADWVAAGMLAWRDEAPGVAYLADLQIDPAYQRFGIATKLLEAMFEEARGLHLREVVVRGWERAPWAVGFYQHAGFQPIGADAPTRVASWADEERAHPLTRPGEVAMWLAIPQPEPEEEEERLSDA